MAAAEGEAISAVERLLDEGFGPSNIVVLCHSASLVASLRSYTVGAFSFGKWGSKGIPVETISRFKGLESEAIVLVPPVDFSDKERTASYVGMSRARSILIAIGTADQRAFVNWPLAARR
jgi:hypothetical protein